MLNPACKCGWKTRWGWSIGNEVVGYGNKDIHILGLKSVNIGIQDQPTSPIFLYTSVVKPHSGLPFC